MAMVIVILLNVLIAQLSYTYSEAKSNAKLQYAIDRMIIVTRIEYSRFARLVSAFDFKRQFGPWAIRRFRLETQIPEIFRLELNSNP